MSDAAGFNCYALISGPLVASAENATTKSGRPCVKAALRTDNRRVFLTAVDATADELIQARAGDVVSVVGHLTVTPRLYEDEPSLTCSMFVTRVTRLKLQERVKSERPVQPRREAGAPDELWEFPPSAGDLTGAF